MRISGIYKIVNKIDGKYYVGSTNHLHKRWNFGHKLPLTENRHDNSKLQNAWNKHGEENFNCVLVENVEPNNLLMIEQKYLDIAKTEPDKCYNLSFVAGKVEMTDEVRQKLSKSHTGKVLSEETREKMRKRMLGVQLRLGMKNSNESNEKRRNALKGQIISEKQKQKISETLKGHVVTEETRMKLKIANKGHKPWNTGKKRSEETRRKIAETLREKNRLKKLVGLGSECSSRIHPQVLPEGRTEILQTQTT